MASDILLLLLFHTIRHCFFRQEFAFHCFDITIDAASRHYALILLLLLLRHIADITLMLLILRY